MKKRKKIDKKVKEKDKTEESIDFSKMTGTEIIRYFRDNRGKNW